MEVAQSTRQRYAWDERFPKGRYRDRQSGRIVSWDTVRMALDDTLTSLSSQVGALSGQLQQGSITLAQWQQAMERTVKSAHLASYALERGGWARMTPSDYGRVGRLLYNPNGNAADGSWGQYQYLRRFAAQIAGGLPLDGAFLRRAEQYAKAARQTYHIAETLTMQSRGFDEEEFILFPGDSCTDGDGPRGGCVERAAAGWNPIGTFGGIGDMNCYMNCRCQKRYRARASGQTWNPS